MAKMYEKSDVFPVKKSAGVNGLDEYPNFGNLIEQKNVYHFCLYMEDEKIYFQKRMLTPNVMHTFGQHGREAKTFNQFRPNDIDWSKVLNKYKRPPVESNRRNADIRTGFKFGSDFLVKAHFTFGQRIVRPDEAHVIQTLDVPLLFYLRPSRSRRLETERLEDGYFPYQTLFRYDRRILEPRTRYRVPPGTVYVLVSTQKNFFRLNLVPASLVLEMHLVDPVGHRVTRLPGMYDAPVKTPYIGDEAEEERREIPQPDVRSTDSTAPPERPGEVLESYVARSASGFETLDGSAAENSETRGFLDLDSGMVRYLNSSGGPSATGADVVPEPESSGGGLLQLLTPPPTYFLIQNPPPPVERNVVMVADRDFVEGYRSLKRQRFDDPRMSIPDVSEERGVLLDLTVAAARPPETMDFDYVDLESIETDPVNQAEMDRLMEELCSPIAV